MLTALALVLSASSAIAAGASGWASDTLRVVTTVPELAEITRTIGGDRVKVTSICKGRENIHSVRTKPSHLVALSKADVFVQMGLALEHAWVPGLLEAARNRRIQPGAPGFVNASVGWDPIQVPADLSRRQGADVHPQGNPHFNLDPRGGAHMADHVLDALVRVDPASADAFRERHAAYVKRLDAAEVRWAKIREALDGNRVVTYHGDFDYFLAACGIESVATIEPKPGVPPTPRHLASVIDLMRKQKIGIVLTSGWSNSRRVAETARKAGAQLLELPHMVGATKKADTWIAMMDELHDALGAAFGVEVEGR